MKVKEIFEQHPDLQTGLEKVELAERSLDGHILKDKKVRISVLKSLQLQLREGGDMVMMIAAIAFISAMLGLCTLNCAYEWLKEQLNKEDQEGE